jgi:hypothetical protein
VSKTTVLPWQASRYYLGPNFDWLSVLVGDRQRQLNLMLALAARLRLGGNIKESKKFEATPSLHLGAESDGQLKIDAVWREHDILIPSFDDRFSQLIAQLLNGIR